MPLTSLESLTDSFNIIKRSRGIAPPLNYEFVAVDMDFTIESYVL